MKLSTDKEISYSLDHDTLILYVNDGKKDIALTMSGELILEIGFRILQTRAKREGVVIPLPLNCNKINWLN